MPGLFIPVGAGLVASLARPGGNVTGVSSATAELAAKNLELIREVVPHSRRVTVLANSTDPFTKPFLEQIEATARRLQVAIAPLMIRPSDELSPAFEHIVRERPDGLIIQPTLLRPEAAQLTLKHKLVASSPNRALPDSGGLMSYTNVSSEQYREAATYVEPEKLSIGMRWVFVNGKAAVADGTPTGALAGKGLRKAVKPQ